MKLEISKDFTLNDIRELRDFNSEKHLVMNKEEMRKESQATMDWFRYEMEKRHSSTALPPRSCGQGK